MSSGSLIVLEGELGLLEEYDWERPTRCGSKRLSLCLAKSVRSFAPI